MTRHECESIFTLAGIRVLDTKALIDGYGYKPEDSRFFEKPPRCVWWFVKTDFGWIEIGWRKRVISIDWSDTPIRGEVTTDTTTNSDTYVHAWSMTDAVRYLARLREMGTPATAGAAAGEGAPVHE